MASIEITYLLYHIYLWILVLPFRIRSAFLASAWMTKRSFHQACKRPDLQYHLENLRDYEHPTNLYLTYTTVDTIFTLYYPRHHTRIATALRTGQWFRIHAGDLQRNEAQIGYAVLNGIVKRQETRIVVELIAAVAEWRGAQKIWVAIPYHNIDPIRLRVTRQYEPRIIHQDNGQISIPSIINLPEYLSLTPLTQRPDEQLPRLPYLHSRASTDSTVSFESLFPHISV
ncbi:hypothetical protein BDY19DRAFT_998599 [Irpex rosettiformis]|uniref:Uncharacterized protein n=1 Tax=Irpex rosettiformis TaxID=378272 RepID=A0ACB8TN68_9APHY|nr:hypothetical protein BDY19DRAFT_998599 [Irpex rosettiformis]